MEVEGAAVLREFDTSVCIVTGDGSGLVFNIWIIDYLE